MALDIKKFLGRFTGEARDQIARLEAGLSGIAAGGRLDAETINELFRAAHTVKGSSRMLKLNSIAETAHQLEEVLSALRESRLPQTPELGNLLMQGVDAISALVEQVEASGGQLPPADQALCERLARAAVGDAPDDAPVPAIPDTPPAAIATDSSAATDVETTATLRAPDTVRVRLDKLDELINLMGEVVSTQARFRQCVLDARHLDTTLQALADNNALTSEPLTAPAQSLHHFTLGLRDLVMEQERLTTELNDRALVLRMLPLSTVFDPIARVARELGRELGKTVHCEVSGGEIELDRQLIDRLGDALVHLLRNAIDHGIEPPDERRAAGKSPTGQLRLAARVEGVGVRIEISDDGRGLDRDKVLTKAVQKGLLDPARLATITDDQVAELIFQPGFSTSAIITDFSGRGVGMDAVKRTIVDLQGAVSISARPGAGLTAMLQLPLSLAVMRVLLCEAGGLTCGLTAQHVVELIRVPQASTIQIAERPALVLHNEFVPLVPLADLLQLPARPRADDAPPHPAGQLVVVIGVHQLKLGLVVSRLVDERDMVIKPLPAHLRRSGLVSGMVVTGTNALVSVLQAPALLERARRVRGETLSIPSPSRNQTATTSGARHAQHVLVVDDSLNTREIEKEILEAHGYQVTLAEDGLEGWQKALGGDFDAVLTDVEMPGMDGFSLTARLRENPRYHSTPIIIITSRQKEEDKQRGVQVGADAYIVKGDFNQSSLVATLQNLLG